MNSTGATDRSSYPAPHRFTESVHPSDSVEARGNFVSKGKSAGNENRRWHGTRRRCNIGDKGFITPCTDYKCSLCSILKTSFDIKFFKGATGWGRFGVGIYTSSTSSKFVSVPLNGSPSDMYLTLPFPPIGLTIIRVTKVLLPIGRRCY